MIGLSSRIGCSINDLVFVKFGWDVLGFGNRELTILESSSVVSGCDESVARFTIAPWIDKSIFRFRSVFTISIGSSSAWYSRWLLFRSANSINDIALSLVTVVGLSFDAKFLSSSRFSRSSVTLVDFTGICAPSTSSCFLRCSPRSSCLKIFMIFAKMKRLFSNSARNWTTAS